MLIYNELPDRISGLIRVFAEMVSRAENNIAVNDKSVSFIKSSNCGE